MKNRFIALLTTGLMLTSAVTLPPATAAAEPATDPVIGILPDWVPQNFAEAMQFYNTHGRSYAADNVICLVRPMIQYKKNDYQLSISGSMTYINTPASGQAKFYELEIPEKPDKSDEEAVKAYEEYCDSIGLYSHDYGFFETYAGCKTQSAFEVELFRVFDGFDLTVTWSEKEDDQYKPTDKFSFENHGGTITETDIYGWLPDSPHEFNEFMTQNGQASVHDNYIAYCSDVNYSTGASLKMEQSGNGAIKEVMESNCSGFELMSSTGASSSSVILYQPTSDGNVDVKWTVGREWEPDNPLYWTDGKYEIKDNCSVIVDHSPYRKGSTVFTLVDKDTEEPIVINDDFQNCYLLKTTKETPSTGEITGEMFNFSANPFTVDSINAYNTYCYYTVEMRDKNGWYTMPDFEVTGEDSQHVYVTCKLKHITNLPAKTTRITLYDKDTGKLIPNELLKYHNWGFGTDIRIKNPNSPDGWMYTGPIITVDSNPCVLKNDISDLYNTADVFNFVCDDKPTVIRHESGAVDMIFYTKIKTSGNINGDGEFNIADVVSLKKWLLNSSDTTLYNWAEGDFDLDNRLTSFDLSLMKRELIRKNVTTYVKPEREIKYGTDLYVVADEITMYLGPDTSYNAVTTIPKYTFLTELGVQNNNDNWAFTEYKGQYGWVQMITNNGDTQFIFDYPQADKPVIYLYPESETDVHVELELTEADLSTTYPKYNNGWDVTAYPDGTLLNKADGTHHKYLFWDAVNCRTRFDFSKGFCVAGSDTEKFLKEKLTYMGLTENEMNEFIVYWLPRMEHNKYNLISFQSDAYTNSAKLNITPTPDSLCRIFMTYIPLENSVDIEPQQLPTFERNGFTVVEWGGSEIK